MGLCYIFGEIHEKNLLTICNLRQKEKADILNTVGLFSRVSV